MVGVAEHVAGAVEAGALAVPNAEHAVVLALAAQLGLLRAPQRGGRQVLVQAGHELDVVGLEDALRAQHRRFQRGDRRAAVTRHVARGVEACLHVAGALGQHQAHDRLGAGQQLPALVESVLVVEADDMLGHMGLQLRRGPRRRPHASPAGKSSGRCNRDARVYRRSQTWSARLGLPGHPSNMGRGDGGRNRWSQVELPSGILFACGALGCPRAQQYCAICSPG